MNRRGITPIIAIILLLMMTVAVAGAAFYWLVKIQGSMQSGTESFEGKLVERMAGNVGLSGNGSGSPGCLPCSGNHLLK